MPPLIQHCRQCCTGLLEHGWNSSRSPGRAINPWDFSGERGVNSCLRAVMLKFCTGERSCSVFLLMHQPTHQCDCDEHPKGLHHHCRVLLRGTGLSDKPQYACLFDYLKYNLHPVVACGLSPLLLKGAHCAGYKPDNAAPPWRWVNTSPEFVFLQNERW